MRGRLEDPASFYELEERFAEREPILQTFLPEEGRFARLRREIDEASSSHRGPLFGTPIGIKDIFRVDGFPTRAGSRLPPELFAGPEAEAVTRLRRQGALILGKTVSTEFAFFAPGPTRNPVHPEHTPGGSSSGSAAAVGAGLCPAALGTQTIGSIIRPAAYCGVVGFKPSYGRISTEGVIPLAPSLDHVGFFTVNVPDAIALAAALIPALVSDDRSVVDPLFQPVLGIPEGPYLDRASAEGLAHFRETCDRLSTRYEIRSVPAMADFAEIRERHMRLTAAEIAQVHVDWFPRYRDLYAPQTVELIERGQAVSPETVEQDRAGHETLRDELTCLMDAHGIDLWISPSAQGPAPRGLASTGDPVMNLPWTQAGLPVLGIPSGRNAEGLPMGLQITGHWWADEKLLQWGATIARDLAS
jgi:Asp-tRNA(Asn)/Glu-tRNA(Gln) amidotransferase A subunit family amidase